MARLQPHHFQYDNPLILSSTALLLLGLLMVASTSINIAVMQFNEPLYFFWRQLVYIIIALILTVITIQIPLKWWQTTSIPLLFSGMLMLLLVVIPGIGHEVNGSMRWFSLGFMSIQPSEPMKLFMILFVSGYLIRRSHEVQESLSGFVKPMAIVCIITGLLLLEPDYGATVVLFGTVLGMLFLAGVPLRQFTSWIVVVSFALVLLMIIAPYRIQRLTSFMNPWADPFDKGFQLVQALIAIGRGELFGVGLGLSVQKLTYLPEAHTDFLFAILAEEFGLFGVLIVIGLFVFLIHRTFAIALNAERHGMYYAAYIAYGIGLCFAIQTSISMGVNLGLLPTKGLTLPLMSYGGSSMIVNCMMLGFLLRIDYEAKRLKFS
ncbi:putative lipid II flippase FtsW [Beggiatoa leptomitoformis]|uniref:Probable peptidoglycan glycosyltransferase FtsW n=1 Tax=Beggiatoa leptomitoformis TaxID=288004 RepID=A0A2N9YDF0_9GAMM|nr:putative lipid II flippase FtsW [Beggiatoa leptomitoformis]ALG69068.1 putative lipid II flippase FtsW [Beggiatoa leptomitoformis]AUI68522.1 putative lipid II flippase FtsW [Beggiatoa leptomitoformis]